MPSINYLYTPDQVVYYVRVDRDGIRPSIVRTGLGLVDATHDQWTYNVVDIQTRTVYEKVLESYLYGDIDAALAAYKLLLLDIVTP